MSSGAAGWRRPVDVGGGAATGRDAIDEPAQQRPDSGSQFPASHIRRPGPAAGGRSGPAGDDAASAAGCHAAAWTDAAAEPSGRGPGRRGPQSGRSAGAPREKQESRR